jgi:hypothetical protein
MKMKVKRKVCDRCPTGRELPATRSMQFSLGDTKWEIDVCEKHGDQLEREFGSWGSLGREMARAYGDSRLYTPEYAEESRRVAELRTKQSAEDRAKSPVVDLEPLGDVAVTTAEPESERRQTTPTDGRPWSFTDHARERLEERGVDILDALHTATSPFVTRQAQHPPLLIHERGEVKVVVDPITRSIITVGIITREGMEI